MRTLIYCKFMYGEKVAISILVTKHVFETDTEYEFVF